MGQIKRALLAEIDRHRDALTLGELVERHRPLLCACTQCGHATALAAAALIARFGAGYAVADVGAELRCLECGGKHVATGPESWRDPGHTNWPMSSETPQRRVPVVDAGPF